MAMSPMNLETIFYLSFTDENDPESPIEAHLVSPDPSQEPPEKWESLGNSFGAETREKFVWLVQSAAQFHGRQVVNTTGVNP